MSIIHQSTSYCPSSSITSTNTSITPESVIRRGFQFIHIDLFPTFCFFRDFISISAFLLLLVSFICLCNTLSQDTFVGYSYQVSITDICFVLGRIPKDAVCYPRLADSLFQDLNWIGAVTNKLDQEEHAYYLCINSQYRRVIERMPLQIELLDKQLKLIWYFVNGRGIWVVERNAELCMITEFNSSKFTFLGNECSLLHLSFTTNEILFDMNGLQVKQVMKG